MPPKLSDTAPPAAGQPAAADRQEVVLSDAQFSKLVELLTPGYECAKAMLADRVAYEASKKEPDPVLPPDPENSEAPKG